MVPVLCGSVVIPMCFRSIQSRNCVTSRIVCRHLVRRNPYVFQVNSKCGELGKKIVQDAFSRNPYVFQVNSKRYSPQLGIPMQVQWRRNPYVFQVNSKL